MGRRDEHTFPAPCGPARTGRIMGNKKGELEVQSRMPQAACRFWLRQISRSAPQCLGRQDRSGGGLFAALLDGARSVVNSDTEHAGSLAHGR